MSFHHFIEDVFPAFNPRIPQTLILRARKFVPKKGRFDQDNSNFKGHKGNDAGACPVASVLVSSDTQYNNLKTLTKIAKQSIQSQN